MLPHMMEVRAGAEAEGMEDRGFLALSTASTIYTIQDGFPGAGSWKGCGPPLWAGLSNVNLTQENALSPWSPG